MWRWLILERILVDTIIHLKDPLRQNRAKNEGLLSLLKKAKELKDACKSLANEVVDDIQEYFDFVFTMLESGEMLRWQDYSYARRGLSPYQMNLIRAVCKKIIHLFLFDKLYLIKT